MGTDPVGLMAYNKQGFSCLTWGWRACGLEELGPPGPPCHFTMSLWRWAIPKHSKSYCSLPIAPLKVTRPHPAFGMEIGSGPQGVSEAF